MTISYRTHQKNGIIVASEQPRYAYGWKPGLGKTYLGCGIIALEPLPTVVVCPKAIIDEAWMRSLAQYDNIKAIKVHGGSAHYRSRLVSDCEWNVAVTTHDTFLKHTSDFLNAGVQRLIVDESGKCRNPEAKKTPVFHKFCDQMREVYLLSGTMAPRSYTNYWAQLRMLDKHIAPYWRWCHRYGYPIKEWVNTKRGKKCVIKSWSQNEQQAKDLNQYLARWCQFLDASSAGVELPSEQSIIIPVELTAAETDAYLSCRDDLVIIHDDGKAQSIAGSAAMMKLRQICGGMLKGGTQFGSSKLEALSDLLDELGPDEPVVIWAEFTHEIDAIYRMCIEGRNEPTAFIDGRTSNIAGDTAELFQEGRFTRLICHPAAAGHGLTFTRARYDIEYSGSFDSDLLEQKLRRIYRIGQDRPVTHYSLLATLAKRTGEEAETVDHSCYRVARKKMAMSAAIEQEVERARKNKAFV